VRIYKITDKLWRVANDGKVKDVWIKNGVMVTPSNPHNILTPTERDAVLNKLIDE